MIRDFLVRLFVLLPISIILILIGLTFIIPLLLWLFFGFNYMDWGIEFVQDLGDRLL